MKYGICIVLFVFVLFGFSEEKESIPDLLIVDRETLQPIENCCLTDGVVVFGYTDKHGRVPVYPNYPNQLQLVHTAYQHQTIRITLFGNKEITVFMQPKTVQLSGVDVVAKGKRIKYKKMGITRKRPFEDFFGQGLSSFTMAQYIPNEDIKSSYELLSVHIYLLEKGNPAAPFLLSLYEGENNTKEPNEKLKLLGPVYCEASEGGDYFVLDIQPYHLPMPLNGLYVITESANVLPPVRDSIYFKNYGYFSENKNQAFTGRSHYQKNSYNTWFYKNEKWERFIMPARADDGIPIIVLNPMIYLTMKKQKQQ